VPFESLGAVSYSPSIVTMAVSVAVSEILIVKEWCDLENKVRVRSRSLKMAPFDRSHTSSYLPSIVTTAVWPVSLAISDIFCVKEWRDLEMWVRGHSRSFKVVPFESLGTVSLFVLP